MDWQGHGHLDKFHAGYWKQSMKWGSILFMADVTIVYVTVSWIVTNYFFMYVEKPLNKCAVIFSVMQLWVLLATSCNKCLMHSRPISF